MYKNAHRFYCLQMTNKKKHNYVQQHAS